MADLHPEVLERVGRYLEESDRHIPGLVEGLYLVGSVALNDFQPGRSDIDFVAVTARPASLAELGPVHARLVDISRCHISTASTRQLRSSRTTRLGCSDRPRTRAGSPTTAPSGTP